MDDWLFVRQYNMGIWMIVVFYVVALDDCGFELRHPRCVCNIEVQVRKSNTTSLLTIMLLIERHVSAYSEAIIRFYDC
jgi:hypothetical protein